MSTLTARGPWANDDLARGVEQIPDGPVGILPEVQEQNPYGGLWPWNRLSALGGAAAVGTRGGV